MRLKFYFTILFIAFCSVAFSANTIALKRDTAIIDSGKQRIMIDVINKLFNKNAKPAEHKKEPRFLVSVVPALGYTLSTGFIVDLSANIDFYTQPKYRQNISFINAEAFYDSKTQKNFFVQSSVWANGDQLRFVTDTRFLKYPDDTYGLGSFTTKANDNPINYNYIRFYETVLGKIVPHFYLGGGYNLDYHFLLTQMGTTPATVTDFDTYGYSQNSVSSGINITALYDTRKNPINAQQGTYANLVFRQNATFLGSDNSWESLQLDLRKYYKFPEGSNNVLAIWNMDWFNFNGKAPYMDLPSTGWDTFNNLGRGYEIGRFRGRGLLYLEAEYRYHITSNGLLGGVLFSNAQSFSEYPTGDFKRIIPAIGTGLRVKINKQSNTNVCIDYAYGFDNSRGFFVNLGEMF